MSNIVEALRLRIRRLYPNAEYDMEFVIGISTLEWSKLIEVQMVAGMQWENYAKWRMAPRDPLVQPVTAEGFYQFFHHTNWRPVWRRPRGFVADPEQPSPLDRYGEEI